MIGAKELQRLNSLGWTTSHRCNAPIGDRSQNAPISYPIGGIDALDAAEGAGYWFDHRARWALDVIRSTAITSIWDVGAGTGSMTTRLAAEGIDVVAVEPLEKGAQIIASHDIATFNTTLSTLGLPDGSIDAIGMFDVIEHLPDPRALLRETSRVLRTGGSLLLTVPAYMALWSEEDDAAGHFTRYTRRRLDRLAMSQGYHRVTSGHLFACLVPPAALMRAIPYRLGRRRGHEVVLSQLADQLNPQGLSATFLRAALDAEQAVSRSGTLPMGLSVVGHYQNG